MLRFLIVIAALFGVVYAFQNLKATSGEVTVALGDSVYAVDLTTAAIGLIVVLIALLLFFAVMRAILAAPGRATQGWRRRRETLGRNALSRGFLAIAAGDARAAERAAIEAERRDADRPLTLLLEAQTAQLKGDRNEARRVFEAMARQPETRIAGLRGLHVEAEREGDQRSARLIAEQARDEEGLAPWAARALLRHQTAEGDWENALKTLSAAADGRVLDKRTVRRDRAVILTAQSMALEEGEPDRARAAALEAHELAPDLVPAAVVAGRLLARSGDIRRAARVLETAWKEIQHPEIAEAYAHVRPGDAALDRLKRAESLHRLRPHADAGRLALARAALEAREYGRAREALMPVITTRPTRNALILLAEIEEAETGDLGRAREWLARAVRAPRDPAWTADGIVLERWAPVSPVSGRLDAVEWKIPVEEIEGPRIEIDEAEVRAEPKLIGASAAGPGRPAAAIAGGAAAATAVSGADGEEEGSASEDIAHAGPPALSEPDAPAPASPVVASSATSGTAAADAAAETPAQPAVMPAAETAEKGQARALAEGRASAGAGPTGDAATTATPAAPAPGAAPEPEQPLAPRPPDDPGIAPEEEDPESRVRRFV